MVNYECKLCNYKTIIRTHYNTHIKTVKHKKTEGLSDGESEISGNSLISNANSTPGEHQNNAKTHQNPPKSQKKSKNHVCSYCSMTFGRIDSLTRHINGRCKDKKIIDEMNLKSEMNINDYKEEWLKEKKILFKQIDALIKKAGNTTTNTNNLNLNSYGKEDLSHITNSLKSQLITGPFMMIPKLIEEIHFNKEKPENKNITYPNKKNNIVKVYKNGEWKYCNKDELMEGLMADSYYILDVHYDENGDNVLNDVQKKRYRNFKDKYDNGELDKGTKGEINLLLLNCDEY